MTQVLAGFDPKLPFRTKSRLQILRNYLLAEISVCMGGDQLNV